MADQWHIAKTERYAAIEDSIFHIHFGNKADLTNVDRRRFEDTKDLPLHPDLEKKFNRLQTMRDQSENNAGYPRW